MHIRLCVSVRKYSLLLILLLFQASQFLQIITAAEWLEPGKHDLDGGDNIGPLTILVPSAVRDGKGLPIVFIMTVTKEIDYTGWQEWSDSRGVVVVRWEALKSESDKRTITASYEKIIKTLKSYVPVHEFMRLCFTESQFTQTALHLSVCAGKDFAGLLINNPNLVNADYEKVRPDLPIIFIVNSGDPTSEIAKMQEARKLVRTVSVKDLGANLPPFPIIRRCMDYTLNMARVTHKGYSTKERGENLDEIAKQIQELPGIVDDETRLLYAQYLMAVTGMDKRRNDYERLAEIWLEGAINVALAKEKEDLVMGHEWLSGIVKSDLYKEASSRYKRMAFDELKRMRRDPKIKKEIAAADYYIDVLAMLNKDSSIAKQRIALKDLEIMVSRYPDSHAAKEAEELIDRLRSNTK